jgi:hypothetical protein
MTKDEALKLALDALEGFIPYLPLKDETQCNRYDKAITAIKEALETKDEFVAWEQFYPDIGKPQIAFNAEVVRYVAPQRTWVGLIDEDKIPWDGVDAKSFARAIEAKLKEKNT